VDFLIKKFDMRNIQILLILSLLVGLLSWGCSLDTEEEIPPETFFRVTEGLIDWILPFDSVGQEMVYTNSDGSTSVVIVERTFDFDDPIFTGCRVDDLLANCELESINLAFPPEIHPGNFQPFVSIFLIAPTEVRVMANRVGIDDAIARFVDDPTEIESEIEDNFAASFDPAFVFDGEAREAIIVETISLDGIVPGSFIAPLRMVIVKGVGIVKWEDFNGATWTLEN
jgi:hypothetical protein